jgi:hypothetical protein
MAEFSILEHPAFHQQASSSSSAELNGTGGGLPLDGSVVKLRGLPFRASLDDVLRFFAAFPGLSSSAVYFKRHPDGRPSGEVRIDVLGVWACPGRRRVAMRRVWGRGGGFC